MNLYKRSPHLSNIDVKSNNYKELFESKPLFNFLQDKDFNQRCESYFKQLYKSDPDWYINPHEGFSYNSNHFKDFSQFKEWKLKEWKKEQENKKKEIERLEKEKIEKEKKKLEKEQERLEKGLDISQTIDILSTETNIVDITQGKRELSPEQSEQQSKSEIKKEGANIELNEIKEESKEPIEPKEPKEPNEDYYHQELEKTWQKIRLEEQQLHDYFTNLRIFNKCYLTNDNHEQVVNTTSFINEQQSMLKYLNFQSSARSSNNAAQMYEMPIATKPTCNDLESKLYPWLTFQYPIFERYDGKIFQFPQYKNTFFKKNVISDTIFPSSSMKIDNDCFLNSYKKKLNGKGIVLSISDDHLDLTIRLIRLLRSLENTLPIQIVYYSKLSQDSKRQIVEASRSDFGSLPKQDIWFIDVKRSISQKYLNKFEGFGNKILATLFNSFEEMILVDADTVMLKQAEFFFGLEKYLKTGTVFYKDRSTFEFRPKHDLIFFKKLLPSLLDTVIFNIPQISSYTLENDFFRGLNHYMESGLVVINRAKHFSQPLIMSQLNFHLPIQSRVYGDKELFWLALVISGDENYSFNKHFAASIGEITPESERIADVKKAQTFKSQEICSNHPGHINDADNHTLLWFNSGFRHCGQLDKVNFQEEYDRKRRYTKAKSIDQFKLLFKNTLSITHAIIPPFDMRNINAYNDEHEPERSWLNMRDYCSGYTWCAYSLMGGHWTENDKDIDTQVKGITIEFDENELKTMNELGDVWTSAYDYKILVQDYHDDVNAVPSFVKPKVQKVDIN